MTPVYFLKTVNKLFDAGRPMVVASGSPRDRVLVCLESCGMGHCFKAEEVFTREDVPGRGKPNPDMSVSRRGLGENVLCYLAANQPASQPSQTMSGLSGVHGLMDHYSLTALHFIFTLLHFTHFTSLIACPD